MSLYIKTDKIKRVLLIDGWHIIVDNSFYTDAYEFMSQGEEEYEIEVGGGQVKEISNTGAGWTEEGHEDFCPLPEIKAVAYRNK